MSKLVKWDGNGSLAAGPFALKPMGLVLEREPTFEEWEGLGKLLAHLERAVHWLIGDWLNYGERAYGQKYAQALETTGLDYDTLNADRWVSNQIEIVRRRTNLSWSHHKEIAALEPEIQDKLLLRAEEEGWTTRQLRSAAKEAIRQGTPREFPRGRFSVLYADPPWHYNDERTAHASSGAAVTQYPTLPTEQICALRDTSGAWIGRRLAPEAALFLWATAPCLRDAFAVMDAWGFAYKGQFVWDKLRGFNGHYNDVRHELLLIGLRGSFPPHTGSLRGSVVQAEKDRHSRKPLVFYEIIEEMYPLDPAAHLEIFARSKRPGWQSWGNEA